MKYKQFSVLFLFCVSRFSDSKNISWLAWSLFVLKEWMNSTVHEEYKSIYSIELRSSRTMQIDLYDYATLKKRQL
jgi:hypothetical protein